MANLGEGGLRVLPLRPPYSIISPHPTSDSLCRPRASGRVHVQLLKSEIQPERANLPSLFLKFQQVPKMFRKNTDFISDSSKHWRVTHMTHWGARREQPHASAPPTRATEAWESPRQLQAPPCNHAAVTQNPWRRWHIEQQGMTLLNKLTQC